MKTQKQIITEIFEITEFIQQVYPAQYEHLIETPLFPHTNQQGISTINYECYLDSLQAQLKSFGRLRY